MCFWTSFHSYLQNWWPISYMATITIRLFLPILIILLNSKLLILIIESNKNCICNTLMECKLDRMSEKILQYQMYWSPRTSVLKKKKKTNLVAASIFRNALDNYWSYKKWEIPFVMLNLLVKGKSSEKP